MKKNSIILSAIIASVVLWFVFGKTFVAHFFSHEQQQNTEVDVVLTVKTPQKEILRTKKSVYGDYTALKVLEEELPIETKGKGSQAFVVGIAGVRADTKKKQYWAFYVNNKLASQGAGIYQVQKKDAIVWSLETY